MSALFKHSFGVHEDDWFEVVAAGGIVPNKKPAPDIYNFVLGKMGLSAAECFALEDSANGMNAALAAGIDTLVTVNQYTDTHAGAGGRVQGRLPAAPARSLPGGLNMQQADRMQSIQPFHVMALLARARELEAQGRSIVHMEIGEPDFVTPQSNSLRSPPF